MKAHMIRKMSEVIQKQRNQSWNIQQKVITNIAGEWRDECRRMRDECGRVKMTEDEWETSEDEYRRMRDEGYFIIPESRVSYCLNFEKNM